MKPDSAPWGYDRCECIGGARCFSSRDYHGTGLSEVIGMTTSDLSIETTSIIVEETIT